MLELELLRLSDKTLNRPLLFVDEDLDGVRDVTGVRGLPSAGVRVPDPDFFPVGGLRVVTSIGILSHSMESLENVNFSAFDVRVDVEETVCDRDKDVRDSVGRERDERECK